jgi:metallo-beta-lactamase family protein
MAKKITLTCFGGVGSPTGSNFMLEDAEKKTVLLVDCGFLQGKKVAEDENREPFLYDPKIASALFITHAHIDHIGRIPKLVRGGFRGTIYSTPPTKDIAELMLIDSLGVLTKEATNDQKEPIYTEQDVLQALSLWQTTNYHQPIAVGDFSVVFRDAGHILGSSMIEFTVNGKKILFTGDLGNSPAPILKDTEKISDIDYLVMESVYGDRNHEDRGVRKNLLEDAVEDTVRRGGTLMIPAFSLERTQELLYELNDLIEHGRIPPVPVFIDSPLAIKVTTVYKKYQEYFNATTQAIIKTGDDIFKFPNLKFTMSTDESKAIREAPPPKIILAGSGMSNGGRIIHHEKAYLPDPKSTLLIIGYQVPGSLGRALQDGQKEVRILGETVPVRAEVRSIHGYSAHKDSDHLLEFVAHTTDHVKKVFVVLGEPKSSSFLTQRIRDYLGVSAIMPVLNEKIEVEV